MINPTYNFNCIVVSKYQVKGTKIRLGHKYPMCNLGLSFKEDIEGTVSLIDIDTSKRVCRAILNDKIKVHAGTSTFKIEVKTAKSISYNSEKSYYIIMEIGGSLYSSNSFQIKSNQNQLPSELVRKPSKISKFQRRQKRCDSISKFDSLEILINRGFDDVHKRLDSCNTEHILSSPPPPPLKGYVFLYYPSTYSREYELLIKAAGYVICENIHTEVYPPTHPPIHVVIPDLKTIEIQDMRTFLEKNVILVTKSNMLDIIEKNSGDIQFKLIKAEDWFSGSVYIDNVSLDNNQDMGIWIRCKNGKISSDQKNCDLILIDSPVPFY